MSEAPKVCRYCDGEGNSTAGGPCGFCENGVPLDTQEDWDRTWGRVLSAAPTKPTPDRLGPEGEPPS